MRKYYTLLPALCLITLMTQGQQIKKSEVKRILSTLAADDMQGRETFKPGAEKAAAFLEKEFAAAGLQPLAGDNDFRQSFFQYDTKPVRQELVLNGQPAQGGRVFVTGVESNISWTQDTKVEIAHITAGDNFENKVRDLKRAPQQTLVWVDSAHAEKFKQYANGLQQHGASKQDSTVTVVFVLKQQASDDAGKWSVHVEQEVARLPLCNVAGMITGSGKPDEYVIFSGHYDHIGILAPVKGDSIANGADDDASGVTAVLMLAKYFKKHPPVRSILFVAFTGEEIGGYGSRYFSRQLDPEKIVAMFNIEMIGKESKFGKNSAFITGFERSDFGQILSRNLESSVFRFHPDPYPEQQLFYRSDNATLARLGVPAHTISTTQIDKDTLYHSVDDEIESMDFDNITSIIEAIATSATSIVDGKDTPTRIDKAAVSSRR
ncbi:M20/M25/M40 family metallo-hydrolase [Chitinophaga filiformis]|uniref:M20/M25/M40 family metallo-hydrolase n=1 Tax=Chitinophaga filiformis TaxID=104663 RepID=UPI001F1CC6FF|nr:M20/M25/M40 family metallo-hydrolase [Chitinophaga filiformis]MCF6402400.1 M20/M25/M40 family metallo-hydrolase [Chitinophaga filiformis]